MVNDWKQIAYKKLDADADTITLGTTTAKTGLAEFGLSGTKTLEDFADDGWTDAGTGYGVGTDVFDFSGIGSGVSYIVLSSALSDTQWVLDFEIDFSTLGTTGQMWVGLSDGTGNMGVSQKYISAFFKHSNDANEGFRLTEGDGIAPNTNNGALIGTGGAGTLATGTKYYCRLLRVSATSARLDVFSDSDRTTILKTGHEVVADGITGLDTIKIWGESTGASIVGTVDNIQLWDGTNTVVEGGFEPHDMMKLVVYAEPSGGTLGLRGYVNEDLGGSKSSRYSQNGASDVTTGTEQSTFDWIPSVAENNRFLESIILDFPNQEKLFINHSLRDGGLGSGVAPTRLESVVKYENQVDRLISITIINSAGAGDMKKGSYAILYGAQRPTITHANGNTLVEVQGDTI